MGTMVASSLYLIRQTSSVEFGSMQGSKVKITRVPRHDHGQGAEVEQRLQREAGVGLGRVVVDDRAQAVAAVQHRQPEHREVPDLPERVRPLAGDEGEVDLVDALASIRFTNR
jgi:hypothetical protein